MSSKAGTLFLYKGRTHADLCAMPLYVSRTINHTILFVFPAPIVGWNSSADADGG